MDNFFSFLSIIASISVVLMCLYFIKENNYIFLFPCLFSLISLVLEIDWYLLKQTSEIRNIFWNLTDIGNRLFLIYLTFKIYIEKKI